MNFFDIQLLVWIVLIAVVILSSGYIMWQNVKRASEHFHEDEYIASVHQGIIERESE